MSPFDDFAVMNYYMAGLTLDITEGAFYDKWMFLWYGYIVTATVSRDYNQIRILTDHKEEHIPLILEFIKEHKEKLDEDQESGD